MIAVSRQQFQVVTFEKAATIADWLGLHPILSTGGTWALDADGASFPGTDGICLVTALAGLPNMRITAQLKFKDPTVQGSEDIAVCLNFGSNFVAGSRNYIMGRQVDGEFRITKVIGGTGSTVSSDTFALAQDAFAEFILERVGTNVAASIETVGSNPSDKVSISGSVSTSDVPAYGPAAFRSSFGTGNSTVSCKTVKVEMWR